MSFSTFTILFLSIISSVCFGSSWNCQEDLKIRYVRDYCITLNLDWDNANDDCSFVVNATPLEGQTSVCTENNKTVTWFSSSTCRKNSTLTYPEFITHDIIMRGEHRDDIAIAIRPENFELPSGKMVTPTLFYIDRLNYLGVNDLFDLHCQSKK